MECISAAAIFVFLPHILNAGLSWRIYEKKKDVSDNYRIFLSSVSYRILAGIIRDRSCASVLSGDVLKSEKFREQRISGELYKKLHKASGESGDWLSLLTVSMAEGGFYPEKVSENQELYRKYKPEEFQLLLNAYPGSVEGLRYFPVASSEIVFENTWMAKREYGGNRSHEGTDLFGTVRESGYYPVISMTDGTVEQKGWLPLGGYPSRHPFSSWGIFLLCASFRI